MQAEIGRAVQLALEGALRAEVTRLVGREKYRRRATAEWETTAARCSRCGANWSTRFWRDGSYPRTLLTLAAAVELRVPRVACICGGTVPLEFELLAPYQRGWGDLQERARELAGLCLSLGASRAVLAWENGQPLAASTVQGWVRQAAGLAETLRTGALERVPTVVMLDGVWVKLLAPTGEHFADRGGRRRERVKRGKAVLLVAYAVDPATGEHWVLDWERAEREDQASWQRLLERLLARGLRAHAGLELFIHDGGSGLEAALAEVHFGPGVLRQRCVFHVLKNLRDAVRGEPGMGRQERQERRRAVLEDAAVIWQTTDRAEVYRRRGAFRERWQAREPTAVATLERAFGGTLAYLEALDRGRERGASWDARYLRTTSHLERFNRALRQKARQVGTFKAEHGLLAGLVLSTVHAGRSSPNQSDDLWTEVLEAALLAS